MDIAAFFTKNKKLLWSIGAALGLFLIPAIAFAALAEDVKEGATLPFDTAILESINRLASPGLDAVMVAYTNFGGVVFVSAVTLLLVGLLLYRKHTYGALLVFAGVSGSALIDFVLKAIFERSRPDLWTHLISETSFSFPSGHAVASSALAACVVVLLWRTKWRIAGCIGAVVYVLSIGFSRLYLGVHYPTDILGGWLLSLIWVSVVATLIYLRLRHKGKQAPKDTDQA